MTDSQDWVLGVRVAEAMQGKDQAIALDARLMVERLTGNAMLCGGPIESFSKHTPSRPSVPGEEEVLRIDHLYGRYDPQRLLIEIFINRIRGDAPRLGGTTSDLLTIVRLHEYAHAVVHVGVDLGSIEAQLTNFGPQGETDWDSFRAARDEAFLAIDEASHEILAQAIVWACLCERAEQPSFKKTIEVFLALEARQPPQYTLPANVRVGAQSADWRLILKAARGEADAFRGPMFSLADGLAELMTPAEELSNAVETPSGDPLVPLVTDLQRRLACVDQSLLQPGLDDDTLALTLQRKGHIKLQMYKEVGHYRPHFHIVYKREHKASYALDTFTCLAGYMPGRYEEQMLRWARSNRDLLVSKWQSLKDGVRIVVDQDRDS